MSRNLRNHDFIRDFSTVALSVGVYEENLAYHHNTVLQGDAEQSG